MEVFGRVIEGMTGYREALKDSDQEVESQRYDRVKGSSSKECKPKCQ
jgi:hypothetical protein